jgi:ATP-dependent DNA helicase RecQ
VYGFDRPNIWLGVETFADEVAKQRALIGRVQAAEPPGIIYVATRAQAEEIAALLRQKGLKVTHYHAGMSAKERQAAYEQFMADEIQVMVATIAFGMGVDKPNVRFVYHYAISDSVDAYYQEVGRAGRDGADAVALLFYCPADLGLRRYFVSSGQLEPVQVQQVAETLQAQDGPVDLQVILDETDLSKSKVANALNRLTDIGAAEQLPNGQVAAVQGDLDPAEAARRAAEMQARRREFERSRLDMIRGYAEGVACRRRFLLSYFGEDLSEPCGHCDNCNAGLGGGASGEQPYPVNSRVVHREWGEGQVLRYEGATVVVLFEQVGYKTLAMDIVQENGLLQPA